MTTEAETRVRELVELLVPCYCTTGSFVHGCRHTVRRLLVHTATLPPKPALCHVCAGELGLELGEKTEERCDGCRSWQAWRTQDRK